MKFVAPFMFMCLFVGCSKSAGSDSASVAKNVGMSEQQQKQDMTPNLSCYNAMMAWKRQFIDKSDAEEKVTAFKAEAAKMRPDPKGLVYGVEKASIAACTSDIVLNGQAYVVLQDRADQYACTDMCDGPNQGVNPPEDGEKSSDKNAPEPSSSVSPNVNIAPQILDAPP